MYHKFVSSRISKGNTIFPITVVIDDYYLHYSKGSVVGFTKKSIPKVSIASIGIVNRIFFSDLIIETRGGNIVQLNGFLYSDAKKMYYLLKGY